jgi:hypothetical protein
MNSLKRQNMNANKKIFQSYSFLALAAALALGSCSKSFVTKTPADGISPTEALNSPAVLQSALNGVYAEIRNVSQYGRDWPVIGDIMADNTFLDARNSGRYVTQFDYSVPVTDQVPQDMWAESYTGILRCNQIIDANVTGAADIKAQAYALRALLYWKLVTTYATSYTAGPNAMGVPLILHYDVKATPARSSVGAVYTQVVSDLQTAFTTAPAYSNSVYLSKYAIEGLLARVYLYEADYVHAEAAAADVINKGPFTLVTPSNFTSFWANPGVKSDAVEVMFEVDCDAVDNNGFDDLGGIYVNGYDDIYCSADLANLYSPTDVRGTLIYQDAIHQGSALAWVVNKYPNAENTDKDNIKVIRLAEVYLIAAEAAARQNQTVAAQNYLNGLMAERDPSIVYASTGANLITDIITERRKELAFEGDRLFDLNRLGLPINRGTNPGSAVGGDGLSIPYPDNQRVSPIPQQEMLRNPNMTQNPGY